jgi:DNA-binding response OmpR family regulator
MDSIGGRPRQRLVLVADDDPGILTLLRATLADEETRLLEAADGAAAWALLRAHRPSIAILDVYMPGKTGLELTRSIRADPDLAGMRVILLTARAAPDEVTAGMESGADRYLTKPFSPLELIDAVG